MSIGTLDALNAYGRAINTKPSAAAEAGFTASASESGALPDFGAMMQSMVTETATTMHAAETAGAKQVAGKGDIIDVVTAIGSAETALNTVVAVRDRVVGAYNEIMRMQV
jgi:flagellar hook-basal body complex protein FliE